MGIALLPRIKVAAAVLILANLGLQVLLTAIRAMRDGHTLPEDLPIAECGVRLELGSCLLDLSRCGLWQPCRLAPAPCPPWTASVGVQLHAHQ